MYRTENETHTIKEVKKFLKDHQTSKLPRITMLKNYYVGKHEIINKTVSDSSKPNNKLVNNFAKYITDMNIGYFVGTPITYTSTDDALMEAIDKINDYNDEHSVNMELAKDTSISGLAFEILYSDSGAQPRFKRVDSHNTFVVYDNTLEENIVYGVYYRVSKDSDDKEITYIDVYEKDTVYHYSLKSDKFTLIDEEEHFFGDVPINPYYNNAEELGDFETVISLIDSYNKAQSNTLDDMDQFTDAYLALTNMSGTDREDTRKMKEDRIILLETDGKAEWLIKNVNDSWVENFKTRLKQDIHKFSLTPALDDEAFGSNLTGVAIKFKLIGLEQQRINKERNFKKANQRRIEMITNFLNTKGANYNYLDIKPVFTANIPQNIVELAELVQKIVGVISEETLLSILPFVTDVQEELKRKQEEVSKQENPYGNQNVINN